jgi:hypothetical protein
MHAGFVPQRDFFIYVPLLQKQAEIQDCDTKNGHTTRIPFEEPSVLKNWERIALPGQLTVYTHTCGEEENY